MASGILEVMDRDPCHELEMARAALDGVRRRLSNPLIDDPARKTLEALAAGLRSDIEHWRPRCECELRKEEE